MATTDIERSHRACNSVCRRGLRTRHAWLLIAFSACGRAEHAAVDRDVPIAVTVAVAHDEALPVWYRASGTVRGRSTVAITSKVSGYVRAVHLRAGDRVTAGQLLVELEAKDIRAEVSRQRAELARAIDARAEAASGVESARVTAQLAGTNLERERKLIDGGAITRQAFDQTASQASAAAAQLAAAEARLRAASSSIDAARAALAEGAAHLDDAHVIAPFTGRVVERLVDPGALASPAMPLLVIDDGASLRVEAAVEESRGAAIKLGDAVNVEVADQPAPLLGTVGEIIPNIDVASRAFQVKVDLPQVPAPIRPGAFARVGFTSGTRSRLVVPTTAVTSLGALDRIFIVDGDTARLRMITRGEAQGPWTEVLSGLTPNERVVTNPANLRDGAHIVVKP